VVEISGRPAVSTRSSSTSGRCAGADGTGRMSVDRHRGLPALARAARCPGWRATAETYADPELLSALKAPVRDCGPVPEPAAR